VGAGRPTTATPGAGGSGGGGGDVIEAAVVDTAWADDVAVGVAEGGAGGEPVDRMPLTALS